MDDHPTEPGEPERLPPAAGRDIAPHRPAPRHEGRWETQAVGFHRGPAPQAEPPPGSGRPGLTLRDLLIQGFYNRILIRNCLAGGLALGLLAALFSHTQYTADSLLLMLGNPDRSLSNEGGGAAIGQIDSQKAIQSEVQLIQSDDILRHAVERTGAETLFPWLADRRWLGLRAPADPLRQEEAAVSILHDHLRADAATGTNVIRVSYTSPDRDRSIRAVKAVVDSYLDRRRQLYSSASTSYLGEQLGQYRGQLRDIEAKIGRVRARYGVLDIGQDIALASNRLDGIAQRQNQVRERQTTVHAETLAAEARLSAMPQQVFDSKEVSNNAANDDARNTLLRLQQDREHMAAQYAADWPALRELDQKIAAVRAGISASGKGTFFTARSTRNPVFDQLNGKLTSLEVEDQSLGKQLDELDAQYKQAQKRVDALRDADSQLHDLQRAREVAENITKQLSFKQAGSEIRDSAAERSDTDMRVAQPADAPLAGHGLALTYVLAGLVLGAVAAAAGSVIATLVRQVYITPGEAERDLDLAGIADFPEAASDFAGTAGRQEVSNLAAFMLDMTVDGRPLSVVQVVSATEAENRAGLARALASEFAQGHGLRTLIVDMDEEAGAGAGRELAPVRDDLPVVGTDIPQLWLGVDAGRSALGSARTLIGRSRETIEALRRDFDMVLVISPSDLSDYAARRLSSLVDANLLVIRSEHTRAPVATQLRDTILAAGGNLLGFAYTWRRYHIPQAIYRWL